MLAGQTRDREIQMVPLHHGQPTPFTHHPREPRTTLLMDEESESYIQHCSGCRRNFRGIGAFQKHSRVCQPTKKRLRNTLAAAKEIVVRKRQRRGETGEAEAAIGSGGTANFIPLAQNSVHDSNVCCSVLYCSVATSNYLTLDPGAFGAF